MTTLAEAAMYMIVFSLLAIVWLLDNINTTLNDIRKDRDET